MNDTDQRIQALSMAAKIAGEPSVKAEIAGCVVTVHAGDAIPETAPTNPSRLIQAIRTHGAAGPRILVFRKHGFSKD